MKNTMARLALAACLIGLPVPFALGDSSLEQERLSAIARELGLVRELVGRSDPSAPDARLQFDYGSLTEHLEYLERAVRAHISLQNSQPRGPLRLGGGTHTGGSLK